MSSRLLESSISYSNIGQYCHVSTNREGDNFVGVRMEDNTPVICFPLGYNLPETDDEIRSDINQLINVLSRFEKNSDVTEISTGNKINSKCKFPFYAYKKVLDYYFANNGKYYVETDETVTNDSKGHIEWARTFKKQTPFIHQSKEGFNFLYTLFSTRTKCPNDAKLITLINKFCVCEAMNRIGWLYTSRSIWRYPTINIKESIALLNYKIKNTNDDNKRLLFRSMLKIIMYVEGNSQDNIVLIGTHNFEYIWEKMVDYAFGIKNKEEFLPRSKWTLRSGSLKYKHPLLPDTIMLHHGKYYILDAKCYKYGKTGNPSHLPNGSSINKQITYGEYLEKNLGIHSNSIYNAFIMPFSKQVNPFGLNDIIANIGEATGEWRNNLSKYERIQGIVIDVRYLMLNYKSISEDVKNELVSCIESSQVTKLG